MNALAPISSTPYYTFDVTTALGLATFVIVADMSYHSTEATWSETTLATANPALHAEALRVLGPDSGSVSTSEALRLDTP
jgi:hypothetical protein